MQHKQEASLHRHVTMTNSKLITLLHYSGWFELEAGQDSVPTQNCSAERWLLSLHVPWRLLPATDIQENRASNY